MDGYQALSVIGFDGPDWLSPKAAVQEEINRLELVPQPHHELLTDRINFLRDMLADATEAGGPFLKASTKS